MLDIYRQSAAEAAILAIFLIREFDREKAKMTTRARISESTLRIIANRRRLSGAFVDDWTDELAILGWSAFPVGDRFGMIRNDTADCWPRIASKRIQPVLQDLRRGDRTMWSRIEAVVEDETAEPDDE